MQLVHIRYISIPTTFFWDIHWQNICMNSFSPLWFGLASTVLEVSGICCFMIIAFYALLQFAVSIICIDMIDSELWYGGKPQVCSLHHPCEICAVSARARPLSLHTYLLLALTDRQTPWSSLKVLLFGQNSLIWSPWCAEAAPLLGLCIVMWCNSLWT